MVDRNLKVWKEYKDKIEDFKKNFKRSSLNDIDIFLTGKHFLNLCKDIFDLHIFLCQKSNIEAMDNVLTSISSKFRDAPKDIDLNIQEMGCIMSDAYDIYTTSILVSLYKFEKMLLSLLNMINLKVLDDKNSLIILETISRLESNLKCEVFKELIDE